MVLEWQCHIYARLNFNLKKNCYCLPQVLSYFDLRLNMILLLLLLVLLVIVDSTPNGQNPYFTITKTNSTSNPIVFDAKSIRFKRSISDEGNTLVTSTYIKKGEKLIIIPCNNDI